MKRRKLDQVRPISCSTNMYDALHGSALFQRGQTQVLCSVTLDSPDSMYKSDIIFNMMSPSITTFDKNFMLHYEVGALIAIPFALTLANEFVGEKVSGVRYKRNS